MKKNATSAGFSKPKPESGLRCAYCPVRRLSVQPEGAGGPRRTAWPAPGGCVAAPGLVGPQPVHV